MKFEAKLNVSDKLIYDVFLPDIEKRQRSSVKLKKNKTGVEFHIIAEDVVAFRATTNSLLKLMLVYEKVKSIGN